MKGMGKILKQAQKMQDDLMSMQEGFSKKEFDFSAGGGAIKLVMSGDNQLKEIIISPDLLDDLEMLQDTIIAAINQAQTEIKAKMQDEMGGLTGGMNIPGLF